MQDFLPVDREQTREDTLGQAGPLDASDGRREAESGTAHENDDLESAKAGGVYMQRAVTHIILFIHGGWVVSERWEV